MGRKHRLHIKDQAEKVARLIDEEWVGSSTHGITLTPEQADKLITLASRKKTVRAQKPVSSPERLFSGS